MKKLIKKITLLVITLLFAVTLIGCGKDDEATTPPKTEIVEVSYDIHTELQNQYLSDTYDSIWKYAKGTSELSKPLPITIKWDLPAENSYEFYISEDSECQNSRLLLTTTNEISIYNLKINTPYYWYVSYIEEGININSNIETFTINTNGPRNLNIDGLTNVRDLGGYLGTGGKRTNQGMIIRSSKLNADESQEVLITPNGINEMLEVLNIKTELDIRKTEENENGGITKSPLGSTVTYFSIPMKSNGDKILINKDVFKDVFAVFGDEANYPIVIHCSIGTDRTGLICFFINALLGVSEDDLYRDYLFSNFGEIGRRRTTVDLDEYLIKVKSAQGDTLSEKTYNFLVGMGVNSADLDTIIKVMLG